MLGKIVDKDGVGRAVFIEDGAQGRALGALVGEHADLYAMAGELRGTGLAAVIEQVGEHDDVGMGEALQSEMAMRVEFDADHASRGHL